MLKKLLNEVEEKSNSPAKMKDDISMQIDSGPSSFVGHNMVLSMSSSEIDNGKHIESETAETKVRSRRTDAFGSIAWESIDRLLDRNLNRL